MFYVTDVDGRKIEDAGPARGRFRTSSCGRVAGAEQPAGARQRRRRRRRSARWRAAGRAASHVDRSRRRLSRPRWRPSAASRAETVEAYGRDLTAFCATAQPHGGGRQARADPSGRRPGPSAGAGRHAGSRPAARRARSPPSAAICAGHGAGSTALSGESGRRRADAPPAGAPAERRLGHGEGERSWSRPSPCRADDARQRGPGPARAAVRLRSPRLGGDWRCEMHQLNLEAGYRHGPWARAARSASSRSGSARARRRPGVPGRRAPAPAAAAPLAGGCSCGREEKPISRQTVWKLVKRPRAGRRRRTHVSPHTVRHSVRHPLVGGGADLRVVQSAARPRRHRHRADLHPRRAGAPAGRASPASSQGVSRPAGVLRAVPEVDQ